MRHPLQKLFYPDSVIIYGVSDSPRNLARHIVGNLDAFGFAGNIHLAGRQEGWLNGRRIYGCIDEIPSSADLAIILIPADGVPEALEACGRKGIHFAVIQAGGFSEFTEMRSGMEESLLEIARKWNIRFVGPNCIGLINLETGMVQPFFPMERAGMKKGGVSLISQSGGIVIDAIRLLAAENIGFQLLASVGNKLDLNECDYLSFFLADPETRLIGMYLEDISDGRRLMAVAETAGKPIIALKSNTTASSRQIARFHTTALSGDDDVLDAALQQAGIIRARTLRDMMAYFKIFSLPPMRGDRLGVICRSGGQAVLFADAIARHGFTLASFSDDVFDFVRKEVRAGVIRMTNPLDLGDVFDIRFYIDIMDKALQEKGVDGLVFGHTYLNDGNIPATQELIRSAHRLSLKYDKPVVLYLIADREHHFALRGIEEYPIFSDADHALMALSASREHVLRLENRDTTQTIGPVGRFLPETLPAARFLPPNEVFDLLKKAGLPVAECRVVNHLDEALQAAATIGYPVALKNADPSILHKTEQGGVRLNINDADSLGKAFQEMAANTYLVQKMMSGGVEVIIGGRRDDQFGPIILFGLGGIFVEVIRDRAIRVAPIGIGEAHRMIEETKGAAILHGFRGQAPSDIEALANVMVGISQLLADHPQIKNLDINPLFVLSRGQGCIAVDGKIEVG